jgi:hypothetical protein
MKSAFLAAICFVSLQATAQKDTSLRKTSIAICNCLEKQKLSEAKTEEAMQGIFLKCMMDSAMDVFTNAMTESNDNYSAGKDIGEKLAMDLLAMGCEPFLKMSLSLAQNKSNGESGSKTSKNEVITKSILGEVIKVEEKDFLYITVKAETGREHQLVYLQFVPSSDEWLKAPEKLKGKKVKVTWKEYEVYHTKIKQFANLKEIKELKLQD